jgi:hypothetical protein
MAWQFLDSCNLSLCIQDKADSDQRPAQKPLFIVPGKEDVSLKRVDDPCDDPCGDLYLI